MFVKDFCRVINNNLIIFSGLPMLLEVIDLFFQLFIPGANSVVFVHELLILCGKLFSRSL